MKARLKRWYIAAVRGFGRIAGPIITAVFFVLFVAFLVGLPVAAYSALAWGLMTSWNGAAVELFHAPVMSFWAALTLFPLTGFVVLFLGAVSSAFRK